MSQLKVLGLSLGAALFLAVFAGLLSPTSGIGSAWNDFGTAVANTPDWPTFVDPFAPTFVALTITPDSPTYLKTSGGTAWPSNISWVGCENSTLGRASCINTNDLSTSYVRVYLNETSTFTGFQFYWNASVPGMIDLDHTMIRRHVWTVSCRVPSAATQPVLDTSNVAFPIAPWMGGEAAKIACPVSGAFGTVTREVSWPAGTIDITSYTADGADFDAVSIFYSKAPYGASVLDVSYINLQVYIATEATGCQAPEGAWFPWADEIACAIGQFGQIVAKGILWFFNGIVFVVTSIVVALAYIASVIVSFLTTAATVVVFFIAVPNVPPIVQAVIAIPFVIVGAVFVYSITTLLRGTGPI